MLLPRNIWFLLAFALAVGLTPPAAGQTQSPADSKAAESQAQATPPAAQALAPRREGEDMVMGAPTAPVTLIEYASLTCPHCAHFDEETFPKLKSEYIDRGLVKYVYRDFPLDRVALQASKIARCAGPDRYFFNKCLNDKSVEDAVLAQSLKGEQEFKVSSTPTLIINGKTYPGALTFEELDKVLKPLVGKS